jgi:hypothetical protein
LQYSELQPSRGVVITPPVVYISRLSLKFRTTSLPPDVT